MGKLNKKKLWILSILIGLLVIFVIVLSSRVIHHITPYNGKPQTLNEFSSELEPKQMTLNITAVGDSLTKGVGDPEDQGYAGLTAKALGNSDYVSKVFFNDYGIKGDTTDDLLKVLNKKNVQEDLKNSDIIFMTIGGNDLVQVLKQNFLELDIKDFTHQRIIYNQNLNNILLEIRKQNPTATIYYMGLYNPFEDYLEGLNEQFKAIIDEWNRSTQTILNLYPNTRFVPTYDLFTGKLDDLLYSDHFHPNSKGYKLISDRLFSTIMK